jgi:hypothetical protein
MRVRELYGGICSSEYGLEEEKKHWMIDRDGRRGMNQSDFDVEKKKANGAKRVYISLGKA